MENVGWEDAMEFCNRLSQRTGRHYTLPSEAQWEYACRAGTSTPFHFGATITPELANYDGSYTYANGPKGEYRKQTTPVGMFPANAWGLRWVPFSGQVRPLVSLTRDGMSRVRSQYRPHWEFCHPVHCGALHGSTSIGSGPG